MNYNTFQQANADKFNRLAAISGVGQTAASQLSSAGQAASGNVSNILLNSAAQQGNSIQNAAAARASGYALSANAWSGALTGGGHESAGSLADELAWKKAVWC
jgi:hypothetical protein